MLRETLRMLRAGRRPGVSTRSLQSVGFVLVLLVIAAVFGTVAVGAGLNRVPGVHGGYLPVGDLLVDICIAGIALVVIVARPRNAIGWLLLAFAVLGSVQNFAEAYGVRAQADPGSRLPFGSLALSLGTSLWIPAAALPATLLLNLYPEGRVAGPFWRWVNRVTLLAMVVATFAIGTSAQVVRDDYTRARPVLTLTPRVGTGLAATALIILVVCALVSVVGAVRRTWRARAPERQQLLLLVVSASLLIILTPLGAPSWLFDVALVAVPAAVAVGVLQYRLLGVEVVIRRTLLFAALTTLVVAVYAGATAILSSVVSPGVGSRVVAAAVVALVLLPLRDRLQSAVDRLVYGARHDPLGAVRRVGASVSAGSADPLPSVVASVADAVRASFVAVIDCDGLTLASCGTERTDTRLVHPLSVAGERVADLVICPARNEKSLSAPDDRVVAALVAPVAAIVHAGQLTRRLAIAHERTLVAAERERSRIRRDLHDGLGPSLSGVALGLEAVEAALPDDAATATALTARMRIEVSGAVDEIRRIIDELRPSALADIGLVPALRERAAAIAARSVSGISVEVHAVEPMPWLPEPVETAAFRIVEEAMTNVVKHADARTCVVRVDVDDALQLSVVDDGIGLPAPLNSDGVGLASMRQRAADLGGHCTVSSAVPSGVVVEARLPLVGA